jgi:hypothetical protein
MEILMVKVEGIFFEILTVVVVAFQAFKANEERMQDRKEKFLSNKLTNY